jgi:DNA-binding transcriptional LysR family regulator
MDSRKTFEWSDLRYFLAVARAGSTLAAARLLGTSQSTVHRRLSELESQLGRKLVIRAISGYRLTELGQSLLPHAECVEDAIAAFGRQSAAADKSLTGAVRVTCSSTMADRLARSSLIKTFHTRYPRLRVEFVVTDKYLDLSKGEADIAIRTGSAADEALVGRKIAEVPWAVYAARSYVERYGRPSAPENIADHLVVAFDGDIADYAASRWLKSVAPRAKVAARSDSWPAMLATVKTGVGLGLLPIHHGDREKDLVRLIDPTPGVTSEFWLLVHPDMRNMPRVSAFFDYMLEELTAFRALLLRQGEDAGHEAASA